MTLPLRFKVAAFIFIGLLFLVPLLLSSSQAQENQSWAIPDAEQFADAIDATFTKGDQVGQISVEGYSGLMQPLTAVYGATCLLAGEPCTNDPAKKTVFQERSLVYQSGTAIGTLYSLPPANTSVWVADVASNIGLAPKAYAQGVGFSALNPILGIWKIMRNVSYSLIILVLLVIGLMIMFRAKIDPRTVISVQSALPRIVISLILITFSYPIAGLMIDIMYVILFLGINIISPAVPGYSDQTTAALLQAEFAGGGGMGRMFASIPRSTLIGGTFATVFTAIPFAGALVGGAAANGIRAILQAAATQTPGGSLIIGGTGVSALLFLIVIIALIFGILRLFFILLNSYIQVIIAVIFAPILLLGQTVPGQSSFSNWMRNLLSNLVVFPTAAILILVADIVSSEFYPDGRLTPDPTWVPPLIGTLGSSLGGILLPLGFALAIPQLVLTIKKAFGAKPIAPVGGAVAKAFGQPIGIVQQTIGTLGSIRLLQSGRRA